MIADETTRSALVTDWNTVDVVQTAPGIKRQMIVGEKMTMCRFIFDPLVVTDEHTHPHEQMIASRHVGGNHRQMKQLADDHDDSRVHRSKDRRA